MINKLVPSQDETIDGLVQLLGTLKELADNMQIEALRSDSIYQDRGLDLQNKLDEYFEQYWGGTAGLRSTIAQTEEAMDLEAQGVRGQMSAQRKRDSQEMNVNFYVHFNSTNGFFLTSNFF